MIRTAIVEDVPTILRLVRELADYERALHEVQATEEDLRTGLFGPEPRAFAHVAEHEGEVVGFALWFLTYSTWTGRHGIHLDDLYVSPDARGHGYGKALLTELGRIADERGYGRVEWAVLNWNESAIGFYKSLGALPQDQFTIYRVAGDAITRLAEG
ncbi:GNAT family N-acetyltransferase [Actinomadura sp. HBU206391]|uniref:GNAT family N-acetyltransferase n=1 Tax=Actinomadura sp. HBU206391 TaxID=2731692 RepID=UPI0016507A58|nr:GNAT family N-acetyltransferase [Actinomadura sp. HBU206391]MBC6462635.1 GNAT family N-acetyltransferase [Actinomadura sp. HBU206391]